MRDETSLRNSSRSSCLWTAHSFLRGIVLRKVTRGMWKKPIFRVSAEMHLPLQYHQCRYWPYEADWLLATTRAQKLTAYRGRSKNLSGMNRHFPQDSHRRLTVGLVCQPPEALLLVSAVRRTFVTKSFASKATFAWGYKSYQQAPRLVFEKSQLQVQTLWAAIITTIGY